MWTRIRSAVQFLTILPLGPAVHFEARQALPLFPMVGLLIGAMVVLADWTATALWSRSVVALVDLVVLVVISGALHLDGLADTADGLYGGRTQEKALEIMKDSRIGAMGMVAVICCLALKWAGLAGIQEHRWLWLLLVPAFARASVLFAVSYLPYGRSLEGTGHAFFQSPLHIKDYWGVILLLALALLGGGGILWIGLGSAILVGAILYFYHRRMQCITGDMLGAMIEMTEAGLFLLLSVRIGYGF